jgi:hypothetical protein
VCSASLDDLSSCYAKGLKSGERACTGGGGIGLVACSRCAAFTSKMQTRHIVPSRQAPAVVRLVSLWVKCFLTLTSDPSVGACAQGIGTAAAKTSTSYPWAAHCLLGQGVGTGRLHEVLAAFSVTCRRLVTGEGERGVRVVSGAACHFLRLPVTGMSPQRCQQHL